MAIVRKALKQLGLCHTNSLAYMMWDEGEFKILWWDFVELGKNRDFGGWV